MTELSKGVTLSREGFDAISASDAFQIYVQIWGSGVRCQASERTPARRLRSLAPVGTPIYAVADGVVELASPQEFYHHTKALVVRHGGFVVRYCEVSGFADGIVKNKRVAAGDIIAYVGKMLTSSMLHFELYAGTLGGPLTVRSNKPFQRRADLINPTAFLDRLATHLNQSANPVFPIASAGAAVE